MDGGFWDVDVSTPMTLDGVARPVPGELLPLGLTRGPRLSRPKQIDFFQRFMAMPFVPSFSNALSLQRVLSLPLPSFARDTWFSTLLGQFNVQKFVTSLRRNGLRQESDASSLQSIWRHLSDPNLYALNFSSEWLLTLKIQCYLAWKHMFPHHNLTLEATSPALFVDHLGNYWDVPFTWALDLASVASDSGASCHFCINHTVGSPKQCEDQPMSSVPSSLLPGLCAKCAVSVKKNFDIWRSESPKIKMVQPYDIFLSNPHISASATLGNHSFVALDIVQCTVVTASLGDKSLRAHTKDESFGFRAKGANSAILADLFATASFSVQHGNFQKLFLDLTRFYTRLDIPSGSKFLVGASQVAFDLYNSQAPSIEAVQAICPTASLSIQQQIAGPFSFRVDAGATLDLKKEWYFNVNDPVVAVEYALQVLGSAKALAWYSPKQREFMIELRFFET
ncbi:protein TRIGALACTOSYLDIACYLGLYCEROL 4, chloroplastic [Sesamum angolense]|uniref:Protein TRIGALACTOSYLDIACYLGLYCEROL 4, chloroplastic n=1 Tax=Sesamum angolense TaxID=2727404 RepID=A0AAE1X5V4_9LAMI|nr:protein TRIGALACTOSYLDIACYLGLYCEROL 4, chloroplastic [Sesamum angolense]